MQKTSRFAKILLTAFLASKICALEATPPTPPPLILYLNSYHHGLDWSDNVYEGFLSHLEKSKSQVRVSTEYMDSKFHAYRVLDTLLLRTMHSKYSQDPPDVIVASDDNALRFAMRHRETFFPNAPIVFCGINHRRLTESQRTFATGIFEDISAVKTIDLIKKLHPRVRRVVYVTDTTVTGRILKKQVLADTSLYTGALSFETLLSEPVDTLIENIKRLPKDAVIIILSMYRNKYGQYVSVRRANQVIVDHSPVPVYSLWEHRITGGVVGGYVLQDFKHGEKTAQIALQILSGTPIEEIPIQRDTVSKPLFDFRAAYAHGLKFSKIPEDASILNQPLSFYHKYRHYILVGIFVLIIQLVVLIFLLINISRRKRAEKQLAKNERYTRNIFINAPVPMAILNRDNTFGMFNKRLTEVYGYEEGEIQNIFEGLNKACADDEYREKYMQMYREQKIETVFNLSPDITPVRCKDGSIRYVEFYFRENDTSSYILVIHDVTEQHAAKEALHNSERELRMMFENHSAIMYLTDPNTLRFIDVNAAACSFYGYSREHFKTMYIYDLDVDDEATLRKKIGCCSKEKLESTVVNHRLANGEIRTMEVRSTLIHSKPGYQYCFVIGHDITERIRMEEQLRHSEKMRAIGQLAGGIAHDFNNQLTGIIGGADMLRNALKKEDAEYALADSIYKAAQNAATLTHQLLTFASARKEKMHEGVVDIHELLRETITLFSHSISRKITIKQDFRAKPSISIGDQSQLQNAFLNLAINARDAFPSGEGTIVFSTSLFRVEGSPLPCSNPPSLLSCGTYIAVRVSDNGSGMDQSVINHAFEPFFTTKFPDGGTGMGLATVYGTVKNHNGAVRIDSQPEKGTCVTIYLPLKSTYEDTQDSPAPQISIAQEEEITPKTILVVDDEEIVRITAKNLLKCLGHTPIVCSNGREAISLYTGSKEQIDLVLIDMIMPMLDGAQTISRLRKINPSLRAVISTGYSFDTSIQDIIDDRNIFSIKKPYTLAELKQKFLQIFSSSSTSLHKG